MAPHLRYLLVFVCHLVICSRLVHCEMFTALVHMEAAVQAEHDLAHDLKAYIAKEEARIEKLKKVANDFEKHSNEALQDPERHLSNPLNAFLLVKRFTMDWEKIVDDLIRVNSSGEFLIEASTRTCSFPTNEDLTGAANALLRLQDTYALPTEKLARGEIHGIVDSPELTAHDCFELGRIAYNAGDHYHSILWMAESLDRLDRENPETTDRGLLLDYYSFSLYSRGNILLARRITEKWLQLDPDHARARANLKFYDDTMKDESRHGRPRADDSHTHPALKNERPLEDYKANKEFQEYEALCRGEKTQTYKHQHKLACRYKRHHPIFYICPAKEETMYLDPQINVYHHLMTDSEIAKVKELASPKLNRATARNANGQFVAADYRISKSAWIKDQEHPLIERISVKTEAISNLTRDTVEDLQVLNYGIGGHYEPHYDFSRRKDKNVFERERGNRIATTIFYMTDVAAGGCTVFPPVGVRICPEKGAMAIWYNLYRSTEGDLRTRHGACPVLSGNKWVCNKWYREIGNEFSRPCALDPNI